MAHHSENLNPEQRAAAEHLRGPLIIIAGAGSGKTKTLTARLRHMLASGIPPERIIAITFTNKAAAEMRERVTNDLRRTTHDSHNPKMPFVGTFHSLGVRILKREAAKLGRTSAFTIFDEDDAMSVLKRALKELQIPKERLSPPFARSLISRVKNELLSPSDVFEERYIPLFERYEESLRKNNAFDFDDLIEKPVRLFLGSPGTREKYEREFEYILVDEFQDVNTAQYRFVQLLAANHRNLGVVGDDAQAIYGFRYADFRNFLNFEKDWPEAKVVTLGQNYRSTAAIIEAASALINNNSVGRKKKLWTEKERGELITIISTSDADREASRVGALLEEHLRRGAAESLAVLYRTNAQSRAIEQELIVRRIPYRIYGGLKFYDRKEVKDVVAALRMISNPRDTLCRERLEKTFGVRASAPLFEKLSTLSPTAPIIELISAFLEASHYREFLVKKFPNFRERDENIQELLVFASTFSTLEEFLERVSLLSSADAPATDTGAFADRAPVNLMTIHLAKGLEFDHVFVVGVSEGLLPHQMSYRDSGGIEEERRLMYVAMTRAMKSLTLSYYDIASRFLLEIPGNLTKVEEGRRRFGGRPYDEDSSGGEFEEDYIEY